MSFIIDEKIEAYAVAHSQHPDELLAQLSEVTFARTEFPQMQVGPLEGAFLALLVHLTKAQRILEIGTFTGYSSLCMARALPENGELITLDKDPQTTEIATEFWKKSSQDHKIKCILGNALSSLQTLKPSFDLIFIDADKENYIAYWEACIPLLRENGLLVADNTLWSGNVLNPQKESDHAIVAFNKHVQSDPRVQKVLLTVRDGMTLARKLPVKE